jgi:hypothetical protein
MEEHALGVLSEEVAGLSRRSGRLEEVFEELRASFFEYLTKGRKASCYAPVEAQAIEDRLLVRLAEVRLEIAEVRLEMAKLRGGIALQLLTAILSAIGVVLIFIFK